MTSSVLVVGVGNPVDPADRAGILVAEAVARVAPDGVDVTTVTDPARLVDMGADHDALVVIDAATRPADATDDVLVLSPADLPTGPASRSLGTHGLGVRDALALGSALGHVPTRTHVVALLMTTPDRQTVMAPTDDALAAAIATVRGLLDDLVVTQPAVVSRPTPRG